MSEWKTIESAPKDGSFFIAYAPEQADNFRVTLGWFEPHEDGEVCGSCGRPNEPRMSVTDEDGHYCNTTITHWMPLPEPPQ